MSSTNAPFGLRPRFILRVWIALKLWLAESLLHTQAIFSRVNL